MASESRMSEVGILWCIVVGQMAGHGRHTHPRTTLVFVILKDPAALKWL
jgi:hypothetical protein